MTNSNDDKCSGSAITAAVCLDCGLSYENFTIDMLLPRHQWLDIHPDDGGLLCARCIVARASKLPGAVAVHAVIAIAPVASSRPDPPAPPPQEKPCARCRENEHLLNHNGAAGIAFFLDNRRVPRTERYQSSLDEPVKDHEMNLYYRLSTYVCELEGEIQRLKVAPVAPPSPTPDDRKENRTVTDDTHEAGPHGADVRALIARWRERVEQARRRSAERYDSRVPDTEAADWKLAADELDAVLALPRPSSKETI